MIGDYRGSCPKILEKISKKTENFRKAVICVSENPSIPEIYRFGEFELNSKERILFRNGLRVSLTPRSFDLLLALVRSPGHLLTKDLLLDQVWADAAVEEGNLNRTISYLRKGLGDEKGKGRFIETVPKAGYRFIAPVESGPAAEMASPHKSRTAITQQDQKKPRNISSYRWIVAGGAFLLLFGILLLANSLSKGTRAINGEPGPENAMVRLTNGNFEEDQAQWMPDNQIRFVRYVTGTRAESWVMNPDGSNQRRANEQIKSLLTGRWSPDGKKVLFHKEGEGPKNIYLANTDGSNERKLPLTVPPNDWSPDGRSLLYASAVDKGNTDIFLYDIETDRAVNITNDPAFDADPQFSPDGTQVVFVSDRDRQIEDYIMNVDGSGVRRLTANGAKPAFPTFSPDATQIVFDSNREGENVDIYLKNVNDDRPPIKLTNLPSNEEHRGNCWSPDGTQMVITSDESGKSNIYVLKIEPNLPKRVFADPDADLQFPSFSPDGSKLIYQAKLSDKSFEIRLANLENRSEKAIFSTPANTGNFALSPVFSPDSASIAFTNKVDGNSDVYQMDATGGNVLNLTKNDAADAMPKYSADGKEIFFQSNRDGAFEKVHLFRMNLDGSDQRRVTNKGGYEFSPVPLSSGRDIVFSGDRQDDQSRALDIRLLDLDVPDNERIIAARRFHDSQPAVSPDGQHVVFVAQSDGNSEIYFVNSDGTGLLRLTRNTADDQTPQFTPDGRKIIFSSNREGKYALYEIELPI